MTNYHVVIGLGMTGESAVDYFMANNIPFKAMDTRAEPPNYSKLKQKYPQFTCHTGGLDEKTLLGASCIILSPGLVTTDPLLLKARSKGVEIISDIEFFARRLPNHTKVVSITGTNGKSTVTSLVGHMAHAQNDKVLVGGNLGIPVLNLLQENANPDIAVLELSSFQLESTYSLRPTVATILNVTEDHMDRYDSMRAYQLAKQRVYLHAKSAVFNRQDALTVPTKSIEKQISFGLDVPPFNMYGILDGYLARGQEKLLPVNQVPLKGQHHWANVLASLALGEQIGLQLDKMLHSVTTFTGLTHRCEQIASFAGIDWYNDSKATNVGATKAAIEGLSQTQPGKIILIAGGISKGADFSSLKDPVAQHVRCCVLMGKCAPQLQQLFQPVTQIQLAESMQAAVQQAFACAQPGDAVLLAPACASFDMFNNFEHRGQCFVDAVRILQCQQQTQKQ